MVAHPVGFGCPPCVPLWPQSAEDLLYKALLVGGGRSGTNPYRGTVSAWLDPAEGPEPVKEALPADPQASFS